MKPVNQEYLLIPVSEVHPMNSYIIGTLTKSERETKIQKYLEKKKNRKFGRNIRY